VQAGGAELIDD